MIDLERVVVYRLPESRPGGGTRILQNCLARVSGVGPSRPRFHRFEASGCFRFGVAAPERRVVTAPITTAEEAERGARAVFETTNELVREARAAQRLDADQLPDPFPTRFLVHDESFPLGQTRARQEPDAWLSRWRPRLSLAPPRPGVETPRGIGIGGGIDVELTRDGRLRAVRSDFRYWNDVSIVRVKQLPPPHHGAAAGGHHHHSGESASGEPELVYVFEAPHEPQSVVAAYWRIVSDGHGHAPLLLPACDFAVVPGIAVISQGEGPPSLAASIIGDDAMPIQVVNGKAWRLGWMVAALDAFGRDEDAVRSRRNRVALPGAGIYHVELAVTHVPTEVTRRTWRQVIVPAARQRERREPLIV